MNMTLVACEVCQFSCEVLGLSTMQRLMGYRVYRKQKQKNSEDTENNIAVAFANSS